MSNSDSSPENNSSENEIESPVDGPTPDWMQMATSSSGPSLTEEDTPDWLKDIKAGKGVTEEASEEKPDEADDSEMSDLERLLAEEGIDLDTVAEERPVGAEDMSARDWMISTSDDELIRSRIGGEPIAEETTSEESQPAEAPAAPEEASDDDDGKMVVEEDLPDWLNEIDEDEPAPAAESTPPVPEPAAVEDADDKIVVDEDLPDWLREQEDETPPAPQMGVSEEAGEGIVVDEDLPDWLREEEDEAAAPIDAEPTETEADVDLVLDEELPDWLREEGDEVPSPVDVEPAEAEDEALVVDEELPDWLREAEDESPPVAATEAADEGVVANEALPDWLREDDVEPAAEVDVDTELIVEDELPDWLTEVDEDEPPVSFEAEAEASEPLADVEADVEAGAGADEALPDWLREEEDRAAAAPEIAAAEDAGTEVVEEAELPDWLSDGEPEGVRETERDEDLPGWLSDIQQEEMETVVPIPEQAPTISTMAEDNQITDDADLPDWLKDAQEDTDSEAPAAEPVPEEALTPAVRDEATPSEDELPDWLEEVQAEEMAHPLFEAETISGGEAVVEDELPDWISDEADVSEPFEPSEPSPHDLEEGPDEALPDWLQEVKDEAADLEFEVDEVPALVVEPVVGVEAEASVVEEKELPDWLQDMEDSPETVSEKAEDVSAPPAATVFESLPGDGEEAEVVAAAPVEEVVDEKVPVPVARPPAPSPPESSAAPSEMPDWLKKLREGEPEKIRPVSSAPTEKAPPVREAVTVEAEVEDSLPVDADERLRLAQTAREKGDLDEAIRAYDSLVSSGAYLDKIIDDLEEAVKSYPTNYLLYQVMGDAMMKDGRLQSALETYREALAKLTG